MPRFNGKLTALAMAILFSSSLVLFGCSSSPDEEQMKQLNDLKDEVAKLQKDVTSAEEQKAALDKQVGEKNAMIKKCNEDQQVVKQRLGK